MKVTTSQKICFGVLGVGLCALVVDRSLGGATAVMPDTADTVAITSGVTGTGGSAGGDGTTTALRSLAERLRRLATGDPEAVRDAFAPSGEWAARGSGGGSEDVRQSRFKAAHTLRAVLNAGRHGQAMVDGNLVRVGQWLDGYELVEVSAMRAVFAGEGGRLALTLPEPFTGEHPETVVKP